MQKFNSTFIIMVVLFLLAKTTTAQYKLNIGNFWVYSYEYSEEKISVIDTATLCDSILYYETHLLRKSIGNTLNNISNQHFKRLKSNGFFENLSIYHNVNDTVITDDVFYKYNAQLGEKWIYKIDFYEDSTVVDTCWSEVVDVFEGYQFGEWRTIKKIRYHSTHPQVPLDYEKYFCDDFGELAEGSYLGISSYLRGCFIDGVAYGDTSFTTVGVSNNENMRKNYSLEQNYPNPFNPSTIINYSVSESSNLRLIVYDIKGEKIAVLIDKFHSAGKYSVNFDVSKFNLSSGIYFYSLISEKNNLTKKMIYLR